MKKVASAIRITAWARAALHHRKEKVSIICGVLQIFSFSLTHAVCLVGWRASRVRLTCLHRLRLHPRMLFAAASRSVDACRGYIVARRRIGLRGCIPFTNTRRRLLPVPLATVGGRHFNFTIPDASRCPTKGRLLRRIGGRKSELAAAGAGQGLPQRKTQDPQDVQRPCTTHLCRYWGV